MDAEIIPDAYNGIPFKLAPIFFKNASFLSLFFLKKHFFNNVSGLSYTIPALDLHLSMYSISPSIFSREWHSETNI